VKMGSVPNIFETRRVNNRRSSVTHYNSPVDGDRFSSLNVVGVYELDIHTVDVPRRLHRNFVFI
jgi:hypothetical protein